MYKHEWLAHLATVCLDRASSGTHFWSTQFKTDSSYIQQDYIMREYNIIIIMFVIIKHKYVTYFLFFSTHRERQFMLVRPEDNGVRITQNFAVTLLSVYSKWI